MATITKLEAENFKRLKAVRISPDGSTVVLGGDNGAGKSSVLDAIEAALGGKSHCPGEPIRKGAKKASVVLETEELVVKRTFSAGGTQLEVTAKDGAKYTSPQAMLDDLVGSLSFDPLAFSRMDAKAQADVVRKIVGLDFTLIDRKSKEIYDKRTEVGRDLKRAKGALESSTWHDDAPKTEQSAVELLGEIDRRNKVNVANAEQRRQLANLRVLAQSAAQRVEKLDAEMQAAKAQLDELSTAGKALRAEVDAAVDEDVDAIAKQLSDIESANRKARENAEHKRREAEAGKLEDGYEALTEQLAQAENLKREAIQSASYPVDGLTVDDDGVRLNGLPWSQASSAEQLRCSVAMGLALNPKLKVLLIRDGSLLDESSLRMVAEMASEAGGQVWLERVSRGDEVTVLIEDGEVVAAEEGPA